jgi:S1-C subfamily serine protease
MFVRVLMCFTMVSLAGGSDDTQRHMAAPHVIEATVIIQGREGSGYELGAGVIIGEDSASLTIVTAYHVVNHPNLQVMTSSRELLDVFSVTQIKGLDIALARTSRPRGWIVVASTAALSSAGSPISVVGFRPSSYWTESTGNIVDVTLPPSGAGEFAFVCDCSNGDSGGGVWNADGRLTGILTGHYSTFDGSSKVYVAEPINVLN